MRISDWSSDVCSSDLPLYWVYIAGVLQQRHFDRTDRHAGHWRPKLHLGALGRCDCADPFARIVSRRSPDSAYFLWRGLDHYSALLAWRPGRHTWHHWQNQPEGEGMSQSLLRVQGRSEEHTSEL